MMINNQYISKTLCINLQHFLSIWRNINHKQNITWLRRNNRKQISCKHRHTMEADLVLFLGMEKLLRDLYNILH